MELIIYCRPRQAILKFANCYPDTNQTAFCRAYKENATILSPYGMNEQETHAVEQQTQQKKVPILLKFEKVRILLFERTFYPFARHIRLLFCDTILLFHFTYT